MKVRDLTKRFEHLEYLVLSEIVGQASDEDFAGTLWHGPAADAVRTDFGVVGPPTATRTSSSSSVASPSIASPAAASPLQLWGYFDARDQTNVADFLLIKVVRPADLEALRTSPRSGRGKEDTVKTINCSKA